MSTTPQQRIIASVEARMTSSRLPGKVLMQAGGKPLLQILLERLQRSAYVQEVVVATTINTADDPIVVLCNQLGVQCFRGSELNVLERVCGAARMMNTDVLVEITGDCPLLDPALVDGMVELFLQNYPEHRYVSNSGEHISMPWGFDVQVFKAKDLYERLASNPDLAEQEHVSYGLYRPETELIYHPLFHKYHGELNRPELRVTLDYQEDYELIKEVYEAMYPVNPHFTAIDIIRWLDKNPEIRDSAISIRQQREA